MTIEIDKNRCCGVPVVKGTRFTVAQFLAELATNRSVRNISDNFEIDYESLVMVLEEISMIYNQKSGGKPVQPSTVGCGPYHPTITILDANGKRISYTRTEQDFTDQEVAMDYASGMADAMTALLQAALETTGWEPCQ